MDILAVLLFTFVSTFTPGPNNLMVMIMGGVASFITVDGDVVWQVLVLSLLPVVFDIYGHLS